MYISGAENKIILFYCIWHVFSLCHQGFSWLKTTRGGTKFGGGGRLIILYAGKTLVTCGGFREMSTLKMDKVREYFDLEEMEPIIIFFAILPDMKDNTGFPAAFSIGFDRLIARLNRLFQIDHFYRQFFKG